MTIDSILSGSFSFINSNFVTGLVVAILVYVIKQVRPVVIQMAGQVTDYLNTKISASKYAEVYQVAVDVWYQVEEDFRISSAITDLFNSKVQYFDTLLLKKFPGLTADELETLRQAISGKLNSKNIETVVVDNTTDGTSTDVVVNPTDNVTPAAPAEDNAVAQTTLNKIAALIVANNK